MPPREHLPDCVEALAIGDGRMAIWTRPCTHADHWAEEPELRFPEQPDWHPEVQHLIRQRYTQPGHYQRFGLQLPLPNKGTTRQAFYAGDNKRAAMKAWILAEAWVRGEEMLP